MGRLLQNLHIKNFKSIRDLHLDLARINVFIGKPNAGKSNILEAISLLSANYQDEQSLGFLKTKLRYTRLVHLFNDFDFRKPIEVMAGGNIKIELKGVSNGNVQEFFFKSISNIPTFLNPDTPIFQIPNLSLHLNGNGDFIRKVTADEDTGNSVKPYKFISLFETDRSGVFLDSPHGKNFFSIVETNPNIRAEIKEFLEPNGHEFLLDLENQKISVVQKTKTGLISFPLQLLPDTFQRYIFHLAAILSNKNSVLLFEEPESHSYAPYIYELAQKILNDEGGNQFFLTTHNPYLLTPILQETEDVALFVTWYENYETHARRLSYDEIRDVLNYGMDLFFNIESFAH